MGDDAPGAAVEFRLPRVGLVGLLVVAVGAMPVVFAAPGLVSLYLLPLGCAVWLVRTRTVIGPDAIIVRRMFGSSHLAWDNVTGLRMDRRARVRAVLGERGELALPGVWMRDLPVVAAASGGRIADPAGEDD